MTKPVNPPKHSVLINPPKYFAVYGVPLWVVVDADGREVERCDSAAAADAAKKRYDAILAREV